MLGCLTALLLAALLPGADLLPGWPVPVPGFMAAPAHHAPFRMPPADLRDVVVGQPLVAGQTELWLTMHRLVHLSAEGLRTAHRHGLPVGLGWRLARDAAGDAHLLDPEGRAWRIPPWRPGPDDTRLGRWPPPAADDPRAERIRAALRRGDWGAARDLAVGTAEHAAVARYAGWPVPPGVDDLAPLPRDPAELDLAEPAWSGAAAPRARPLGLTPVPSTRHRDQPLHEQPRAWPRRDPVRRDPDGLGLGQRTWAVLDDGARTTAWCRDDGRPRWYTRWLSAPNMAAPTHHLALEDGHLVVAAGDHRLLILDAGDGTVRLDLRPAAVPLLPGRTRLHRAGAVVLHPPGRDDRLGWLRADGDEHDENLPAPAQWVLALPDGEVWLALRDGRSFAATTPGAWRPLRLPEALRQADDVHLAPGGVAADGWVWGWRDD